MRAYLLRRPLLWWAAYALTITMIIAAARALFPDLRSGAAGLSWTQVAVQALLTLLPLPFAHALGWRHIGFVRPHHWPGVIFPALTVGFGYLGAFRPVPATTLILAVIVVLLVAVGEEVAFRGVLLTLLLPRGTGTAVAVSSVLFGLTHLVNLIAGAPVHGVLLQIFFTGAGAGAAGFAALRIRTGSLWPGPPVAFSEKTTAGIMFADVLSAV